MKYSRNEILKLDEMLCVKINSLSGDKVIDKISYIISKLGDGSIYFATLTLFIIFTKKSGFLLARDYLTAGALNIVLYKAVKGRVKRIRPFIQINGINKIMPPPDEFSFPSGHSGAAAVFFYCTYYNMPGEIAVISFIWMLLIGFSRVYNGVHYPGDVLAGYFMGVTVAKTLITVYY